MSFTKSVWGIFIELRLRLNPPLFSNRLYHLNRLTTVDMKIEIKRLAADFHMEARNETGNRIEMDSSADGTSQGMSPMQLLLAAIGGCSSIDIISILKKQRQPLVDIAMSVEGKRRETPPKVFEEIHVHYTLWGDVEADKVKRAIELSLEKYCSVSQMLEKTATLTYTFSIEPQPLA
jgi:putative redox protein